MPNIEGVDYENTRSEIVEFVDQSRKAKSDGIRGVNFNTNLSFDLQPDKGLIIPKLRFIMERPDGGFVIKLVVRLHFKVSKYARLEGMKDEMGLPEQLCLTMARETWDYARSFLASRDTPIAQAPIPEMPPNIFEVGSLPPISVN